MPTNIVTLVRAIALTAVLAIPAQPAKAQVERNHRPPRYYVFDLGDPGNENSAAAASINNIGWIAGSAFQSGNITEHAELWVAVPLDLGTLGGPQQRRGLAQQEQ
jgi:hypothetical protein